MGSQDWKFSAPAWYLTYIEKKYGVEFLKLLHLLGYEHDRDIELLGYKIANKALRKKMRIHKMSYWDVRLPTATLTTAYRFFPQWAKDLYHKLTK